MDEILKYVAGGGSLTAALLVYHIWKVVPALNELKQIMLQGQQIDLLKLVRDLSDHPEAMSQAQRLLETVNNQIKQ